MKNLAFLKQIQKRLPDDIVIFDETNFNFSEDEYISILSWIKYFNYHYQKFGKNELPIITYPIISRRLRLDFGLYHLPSTLKNSLGMNIIYISNNAQLSKSHNKQDVSLAEFVETWSL